MLPTLSSDLCFFTPNDTISDLQTNRQTNTIKNNQANFTWCFTAVCWGEKKKTKTPKNPFGFQSWPALCCQTEGALLALYLQTNHHTTFSMVPSFQTADLCHRQSYPLPVEAGSEDHLDSVSHIVHGRHAFHALSRLELNHCAHPAAAPSEQGAV